MQKKTTNRARQARATKNKIYRVGIKLIQKYGIDGVNVTGIAKAAGVSVGTFYHYYTSKLDLLMDLYRSGDQFYETDLAAAIKDMPFREKVQFFFREYASMSENDSVQLIRKIYVPENTLFISRTKGMHSTLRTVISEAQEKGVCIDDMAPADISDELFLVARGVIFDWALHDGKYDLKSRMERMLDIYLNSITCGDDTPPLPSR